MKEQTEKLRVAVHKFSSCDGCQLALINATEKLIELSQLVEIVHFAELGIVNPDEEADIAIIEGSISTPDEVERINKIRKITKFLLSVGACATAGGVQALRNFNNVKSWMGDIYDNPNAIDVLNTSTSIAHNVQVDLELWGCPVDKHQLFLAMRSLLWGVVPRLSRDSLCLDCKRQGYVCVLVTKGMPCMGPVTRIGCGVLCPKLGRDCYECFGPKENPNGESLGNRFASLGLTYDEIAQRFLLINNAVPDFQEAWRIFKNKIKSDLTD
jgi:sulfhydrogenase subunit delta